MRNFRCPVFAAVLLASALASSAGSLIDVAFTDAPATTKTGFAATGLTTNDFWNTYIMNSGSLPNLEFVDGTASGAGLTVANANYAWANGASDPMYGIYLYSMSGNVNIIVTVTNLIAGTYNFYLYAHSNSDDLGSSGFQVMVGPQSYGIEATTNGPGWDSPVWQEGVQYVEFPNVSVPAGQAVTITVVAGSGGVCMISGLQMAYAGVLEPSIPLILDQPGDYVAAPGSIATFGVVAGGEAPLEYQWLFNNTPISAATNSSYIVTNAQQTNVGSYSVVVTNPNGSATSTVARLAVSLKLIDVAFISDRLSSKTGFAAVGVTTNDFWSALANGTLPNLEFVDGTVSSAGLTSSNVSGGYSNGASDPMYGFYVYTGLSTGPQGNITVTVTNLSAGTYDFYLYGHGNADNYNGVFQLQVGSQNYGSEATTNGSGWLSPVWQEGVQYVEFTNVVVSAGQTITIAVEPGASPYAVLSGLQMAPVGSALPCPAFILNQPADQAVFPGSTATFSVVAGGAVALAYQWLFDNADVLGATNSSYSVPNAQTTNAGNYSVTVTDVSGGVTSRVAALNVLMPGPKLIDVAFTGAPVTTKRGYAATGLTAEDFWNTFTPIMYRGWGYSMLPNIKFVDGTTSGAGLILPYLGGVYGDAAIDPMYATYFFSESGEMAMTVTNLLAGIYDFYLYGHGDGDNQNSIFQLTAGSQNYGSEATTNGPGWLSPTWQEGVQYVEFTNVIVSAGQTVTITVEPGASGYAVLSGLQMASVLLPPAGTPPILQAPNQFVNVDQALTFTNYAYSANGPISFTLGSNAPAGARITTNGIFTWTPTPEQGSSTNLITVWATDSGSPPMSNSMTFSVVVGACVEVSIGSSIVQAGQSTSVPVNLVASVGLTNLFFTLAYPSGFLTNWTITPSNSVLAFAGANAVDPFHTQFYFVVRDGQVLQGSSVIGSISLNTLAGASAFVPLVVANISAGAAINYSPATNLIGQSGRVVVVGNQALLEGSLGTNSSMLLNLYGNPGASYKLLTTTNIASTNSWSAAGSVTLTNLLQVINLGGATNRMQFFRAVKP